MLSIEQKKQDVDAMYFACQNGTITFEQLVEQTDMRWKNAAGYLAKRWTPPGWFTCEDLKQEVVLGVWEVLWKYEDGRGPSFARFVAWNAMGRAKRKLHKARGATLHGREDSNPSRHEPIATEHDYARLIDDGDQEFQASRTEATARALAICETPLERASLIALSAKPSFAAAAHALYNDDISREQFQLKNVEHAHRAIVRCATSIAERLKA